MTASGAEPSGAAPPAAHRPRFARVRPSLGTKLILFSTLLTVSVVFVAFLLLSLSIRRQTKEFLAGTLGHQQRAIIDLQRGSLEQLLRISALMTDSPTLRAAMETYHSEAAPSSGVRPDLLETIQTEVDKVAAALGRDLFLVTDRRGAVLAWRGGSAIRGGEDLAAQPTIRRVLEQDLPVAEQNFAVLELGGEHYRAGSVPIVLQGYVIGTLTIGDRIDDRFVRRMQESFDCDFIAAAGGRVVASTLASAVSGADLDRLRSDAPGAGAPKVVRLGGTEYVAASLALGGDGSSGGIDLFLLSSLSRALGDWSDFVVRLVVAWGLFAVALAGLAAWRLSRSVLRPLESFVGFMRSVAGSGDHSRRYDHPTPCVEVEALSETYNQLIESLRRHERRLLEQARLELERLERLKESEKLASLGRMLSGAAHEINNPLTGVVGNLELLLRDPGLDPAARERLERIWRESRRIVSLVRNLLKISHRDTGERVRVDLHQVLRETVEVRRHDFICAGMRLELELASEPVRVLGSELELHQVFLNIVNNAYDALQESSGPGCLTVRSAVAGDRVVVTFADNGPGMESPRQVFDHFYTTKGIGKGTGLGLSICHTIVRRHGGEITAENLPAGGACFRLTLPRAVRETVHARDVQTTGAAAAPEATDAPLAARVLIVDDEPTIVDLQKEILSALGAAVVGVHSGDDAIELLRERPFDIIVTDLKMPGAVSGQQLFRWVESNLPEAAGGFVFVTGDTAGEENREFIERAGVRCLAKPFSMPDYVRTLREIHDARLASR